jgi:hypothetical protein
MSLHIIGYLNDIAESLCCCRALNDCNAESSSYAYGGHHVYMIFKLWDTL